MSKTYFNTYFNDTKEIIDPTIHKFLYALMKYICYGKSQTKQETRKKLEDFIKVINENEFYKSNNIYLNINFGQYERHNCNLNNLVDILNFTRIHNFAMASEIIENIMIRLISFSSKAKSSDFFGKYIYNNLKILRTKKEVILNWIDNKRLKYLFDNNSKDLKDILNYEEATSNYDKENKKGDNTQFINECTFIQFLLKIHKMRFMINIPKNNTGKKNKGNTFASQTSFISKTIVTTSTHIYYNESCLFYVNEIGKYERNVVLPFALSMLISSYIYYQNRHSPLLKCEPKKNLTDLPFKYDLSEAGINDLYLGIILKPIRIEPRIKIIELNKNNFGVEGLLEMYKAIIFNKYIKRISVKSCGIKSKHFKYLLKNKKPFENSSIEELDISINYIEPDADEYLVKIIENLKGLKSFNLSYNNIKGGAAALFAALKNLYRKNKTKLETLILINCKLDNNDFYELGELLKSKYCKLKCLCLSLNKIPLNSNFFKSLKKNRSLKEIYLYDCGINSDKEDEINRIISNSYLESLYIYFNQIHDYNKYIRIIYRNCLIKNKEENENKNILCDKSCLFNLNLNGADCFNRNKNKNKLLYKGIQNTNLSIIDFISVLEGYQNGNIGSKEYYDEINFIKDDLVKKSKENKALKMEINNYTIDVERLRKSIKYIDEFDNIDIENIINNPKSKYPIFIMEEANKFKSSLNYNNEEEGNQKMKHFVDYIRLKRIEKILEEKQKIIDKKKLILI